MLTNRMSWLVQAYVWQPAGSGDFDVPLWMKADSNVYTYVTDGNKNIRQLKNAAGTVVATYDYDPFGNVSATGSVNSNPWQFSSEFRDAETGLIYYNYRYYAPGIGRWISRDPLEEQGGLNLYIIYGNNCIGYWDKDGYHWTDYIPGTNYWICLDECIEANDPMDVIIDSFLGQLGAKMAVGAVGVPKTLLLWLAKLKGDVELIHEIELSMKMGKEIAYKPLKIILDWLEANRGLAARAARTHIYVTAIYGNVLAIIELDCAIYCAYNDRYDGSNILNMKKAIDYYIDKIFSLL